MIVISARELTKAYGTNVILNGVSFHVSKGDRIGIIGINGAGKTTLLNVLAGETACDEGDVFVSGELKIGYLKQDAGFDAEGSIRDEVKKVFRHFPEMERKMEELLAQASANPEQSRTALEQYQQIRERYEWMGGYSYESEIRGIMSSMAFGEEDLDKKISALSGGEKTRLALALLLLEKPDILLLDEPTNHLDIGTLRWLEQYLKGYRGTLLLVSHDRYFLDETVTRIFEINHRRLSIYEGGYRFYAQERKVRRQTQMRQYEKQQKEIARQEDMIRRFKQRGTEKLAKRAASREKVLQTMERIDRPDGENDRMKVTFHQNYQSGKDVLQAGELSMGFGYGRNRKELFRDVSLDIKRGERVCIVGDNGTGKTTLLRLLLGQMEAGSGRIRIGHNVQFGYYDQGQQLLDPNLTVIEELQEAYHLYSEGELRNLLGRFLFRGEQVFLPVSSLSGGEKARLSLLKLMMSGANVLMLDEPTNHLDIESKEVFEEALLEYPGTCIIVSHDRYFLNRIPTRILELSGGGLTSFLGCYDDYMEKKQQMIRSGRQHLQEMGSKGNGLPLQQASMNAAEMRRQKKEREARERRARREKEAAEEKIARLEEELAQLEEQTAQQAVMTDPARLQELSEAMEKRRRELDEAYERWLELGE